MVVTEEKYKMYVCTHIETEIVNDPLYVLLHTGQAFDGNVYPGVIGDDTGDNISAKKDIYDGLLTGQYWVWKNTSHEYKGICTYRGYLGLNTPLLLSNVKELFEQYGYEFIAARYDSDCSVEQHFHLYHDDLFYNGLHNPLVYIEKVLENKYPTMLEAYRYCMSRYSINYRNTFIATRECFDSYSSWIFEFISEFDKYAARVHYPIAPRFYGYLIERLERVWIITHNVKLLELPIVYLSEKGSGKFSKDIRMESC